MCLKSAKPNQTPDLSYKGVSKFHYKFMLISHSFYTNCAWISLDFLIQKNLNKFVDYLGYYKNYFGSTGEGI